MIELNYDMLCSEIKKVIKDQAKEREAKTNYENEESIHVTDLIAFYEEHIAYIQNQSFDEFLKQLLLERFETSVRFEDLKELRVDTVRNMNRTKKRLFKTVEKDIEKEFKETKLRVWELKKIYGTENTDEMQEILYQKIKKEWLENKAGLISSFRYINDKTKKTRIAAFKNDLTLTIIDIALNVFNGSLFGYTIDQVMDLVDHPIFSPNRYKISFDEGIDEEDYKPMVFNDYEVDGNYILRYIIKEKDKVDIKSLYVLDRKDWKIINFIFSKIVPGQFIKDRSVIVDIGDIVFSIHGNNAGSAYKDIEKRIQAIPLYHIRGLIKEGENIKDTIFTINFFDSAIISTDKATGKRYAKIVFGDVLYEKYVNGITVSVTGREMKYIEDQMAKMLLYALQKERIKLSAENDDSHLSATLNYTGFFRHKIRLRGSKNTNIKKIEASLNHYKTKGILIKDFIRNKDNFFVDFYPLSEIEKKEFGFLIENKIVITQSSTTN